MSSTVKLEKQGSIATITFNRPDKMNSFNLAMADDMEAVTEDVMLDDKIRAVILKGEGKLFMAGGDLKYFAENLKTMPAGILHIIRQLKSSMFNLRNMNKPVLAAVHGSVAGVGVSFMLAADLVIAADDTKFTLAYTGIGTSPDGGVSYMLPRLVGTKKAMELMMLSELFDAKTALQHGLINWVAPGDQLFDQVNAIATRLANGPTKAFANVKRLVNHTWDNSFETQCELEALSFAECSATQDFTAGVSAFVSKKKPEFVGK